MSFWRKWEFAAQNQPFPFLASGRLLKIIEQPGTLRRWPAFCEAVEELALPQKSKKL